MGRETKRKEMEGDVESADEFIIGRDGGYGLKLCSAPIRVYTALDRLDLSRHICL